ncbi:MAG: hypothetical protein PGN24_10330 [Microbacterium arborescens]
MPSPRQQRALRAGAAATLATFVALLSHVSAGGEPPALLGVALPWALSLVVCLLVVGRRLSALRLAAAVVGAQVLFHALFSLGVVPSSGSLPSAPFGPANMSAHSLHTGHMSMSASILPGGPIIGMTPDAAMLAAHLVAAIVTTVVLHRGERLVVAVAELARRAGLKLRAAAGIPVRPTNPSLRPRIGGAPVRARHPRPLVASPARRGPPALLAL